MALWTLAAHWIPQSRSCLAQATVEKRTPRCHSGAATRWHEHKQYCNLYTSFTLNLTTAFLFDWIPVSFSWHILKEIKNKKHTDAKYLTPAMHYVTQQARILESERDRVELTPNCVSSSEDRQKQLVLFKNKGKKLNEIFCTLQEWILSTKNRE